MTSYTICPAPPREVRSRPVTGGPPCRIPWATGPRRSSPCTSTTPPGRGARPDPRRALLLPEAAVLARRDRRPAAPPGWLRAADVRGRDRARRRPPGAPGRAGRGVGPRRLGDRRQRRRRPRPEVRRPRLQPPVQGPGRLHPDRPAAARRPRRRPARAADPHLGERRDRPGRHERHTPVPLRRARRRSVPARHPRSRGRHPHRHPGKPRRWPPRRHRRDRGDRRGGLHRTALEHGRRVGRAPRVGRDAAGGRRGARRRLGLGLRGETVLDEAVAEALRRLSTATLSSQLPGAASSTCRSTASTRRAATA